MKLLSFGKKQEKRSNSIDSPLSKPHQWLIDIFGGGPSAAGVNVNEQSALTVPAVRGAVFAIAETMASIPLQVFEITDSGTVPAKKHELWKILHDAPNKFTTSYFWRRAVMRDTLLRGDGITRIVRNNQNKISSLIHIPNRTISNFSDDLGVPYIVVNTQKGGEKFSADEYLRIPFDADHITTRSANPCDQLKDTVGLALACALFGSRFFANDARPGVVFEMPGTLKPEAKERAKADLTGKYKGIGRSHEAMILEGGIKLHQVGVEPEHAQFLETRKLQIEEIARFYRVPPSFIQDNSRSTFSNSEQQDLHFVKHSLRHWLVCFEQELNLKLLNESEREKYIIKFNVDGLLRGDFKTRMEGTTKAIQGGLLTPNEGRELENRPPIEGGDNLFIQQNMAGVDAMKNEEPKNDD